MKPAAAVSEQPPLLLVEGLRTWFPIRQGVLRKVTGYVRAVDGVDLNIAKGKTLALVGESGCGKTTVGRSILRLEQPRSGAIHFDGVDLMRVSDRQLRRYRRQMQIIFQDPAASLDPRLCVRDSIAEGLDSFGIGSDTSERTDRVAELMKRVQLDPRSMLRYPHEFSGGQRQRICIARALAVEPRFLVCDESVSALDGSIQAQILNLLRDLQAEFSLTYLFITHDIATVRAIADEIVVMYQGKVVQQGLKNEVLQPPHPAYTELLLSSVPDMDPDWLNNLLAKRAAKPITGVKSADA